MAVTADEVEVIFDARIDQYLSDLRRATREFERSTNRQQSRMQSFERRMSAGAGRIGAALAGIATLATAREFLRLVDASKQIESQLRLATRETGRFGQAQEDVRRIAMASRSGLEETAELYAVFQRDSAALGITQTEAARATETLTKAFVVSGASAEESSNATRQLIQGLQSGTLRGDEFNSVMEQAPRLQKLFAQALGVSKGELRGMAEEGKITAAALVDALSNTKYTEGIDAEFREMPVTFDQAMQQVENAAMITFGAFDRGGGFSQMLSNFIMDGTRGFADLERSAVETGIDIRSTFEGLANAFDPLLQAAKAVFGEIGGEAMSLADRIRPLLADIDAISAWLAGPEGSLERQINEALGFRPTNMLERFNEARARSENERRLSLADQWQKDFFRGYDPMGNRIAPSGGASSAGGASVDKAAARKAAAEAKRAEAARRRAIQDDASKQAEMLALQDDIIAARAALARAAEDVLAFELQQIDSQKAQRLAQYQTEVRLGDLTQKEYEERARLVEEAAQLRRQELQLAKAERDVETSREQEREALRQRHDELSLEADALQIRGDIADTLEQRRILENSALEIQHQIERELLDQAIAEGRVADAARARALLAERQSAETTGLARRNQGALGRYADSMRDPAQRVEEVVARKLESVNEGISDALSDALGTDDQFVKDLFSIFLDQVIFKPLAEALDQAGGGSGLLGAVGGLVGGIFGGGRATGGPVRAGTPYMVGEGGKPELFVPQQNGVVVPNHRLQGNTPSVVISSPKFDLRGAVVTEQLYADMERISQANAAQAAGQAYSRSMKDAPGAVQNAQRYGRR